MVRFESLEFRKEIASAIESWNTINDGDIPDGLVAPEEWDVPTESGDEDLIITPESGIELSLSASYERHSLSCGQFVALMREADSAILLRGTECRTPHKILVRVVQHNAAAFSFLNNAIPEAESDAEFTLRKSLIEQKALAARLEQNLPPFSPNVPTGHLKFEEFHRESKLADELEARYGSKHQKHFLPVTVKDGDNSFYVSLVSGLTVFGIVASKEMCYDDEYGPRPDDEIFIEIRFTETPTDEQIRNITGAYLFELAVSLKAEFEIRAIPEIDYMEDNPVFIQAIHEGIRLRPLMLGKGMNEVLELCAKAVVAPDSEFRILYATKVIEYVAQTVIRKQSFEKIRAKLLSPRALSPDAAFISELQGIVSKSEKTEADDGEAIRQTILCCCDATELARVAPKDLNEFRNKKLISDPKIRSGALSKFARMLYAARNSIAHAKANYKITGNECPAKQLPQLAECSLCAAQQVIRWFHSTPEDIRVVS
jgi:hypothetical protein